MAVRWKTLASIVGVVIAAGTSCIGIADKKVDLPHLALEGEIQSGPAASTRTIQMTVPGFYFEPEAFQALVEEDFRDDYLYDRARLPVSPDGRFSYVFPEEHRLIGFPILLVPLAPSKATSRSRTIFLRLDDMPVIYRIRIRGKRASVRVTPARAAIDYWKINWERTRAIEVVELSRSGDSDAIGILITNETGS